MKESAAGGVFDKTVDIIHALCAFYIDPFSQLHKVYNNSYFFVTKLIGQSMSHIIFKAGIHQRSAEKTVIGSILPLISIIIIIFYDIPKSTNQTGIEPATKVFCSIKHRWIKVDFQTFATSQNLRFRVSCKIKIDQDRSVRNLF